MATSCASSTGLYSGPIAIAVPTRTRRVRAAIANDSGTGEGKYSSEYLCSVVSAASKPSRSAASACSRISRRVTRGSPVTSPWVNSTPKPMTSLLRRRPPAGSDADEDLHRAAGAVVGLHEGLRHVRQGEAVAPHAQRGVRARPHYPCRLREQPGPGAGHLDAVEQQPGDRDPHLGVPQSDDDQPAAAP